MSVEKFVIHGLVNTVHVCVCVCAYAFLLFVIILINNIYTFEYEKERETEKRNNNNQLYNQNTFEMFVSTATGELHLPKKQTTHE